MMTKRFVLLLAVAMTVVSCRPSQQSRRSNNAASKNAAAASQTKTMDSLLLVQDKLITVIDTMSGLIAADRRRINDLEREVAKLRSLLEQQRFTPSYQQPAPPPVPQSAPDTHSAPPQRELTGAPVQPRSSEAPKEPIKENNSYTAALRLFNEGKFVDALASFDDLSRKDNSSPLAPNYLYWKGESLYALGEYKEAVRTFHGLLESYPQSAKAPDAEFKIGASYEKLGDMTNAKSAYQRLILSFPESDVRPRAELRLNKLK
jgi:tol-pal system protein YbgF